MIRKPINSVYTDCLGGVGGHQRCLRVPAGHRPISGKRARPSAPALAAYLAENGVTFGTSGGVAAYCREITLLA